MAGLSQVWALYTPYNDQENTCVVVDFKTEVTYYIGRLRMIANNWVIPRETVLAFLNALTSTRKGSSSWLSKRSFKVARSFVRHIPALLLRVNSSALDASRRFSWGLVQHVGFRVSVGHSVVSHFASLKVHTDHTEQLLPVICMQCAHSRCDQELGISSKRPASVDHHVLGTVPVLLLKT